MWVGFRGHPGNNTVINTVTISTFCSTNSSVGTKRAVHEPHSYPYNSQCQTTAYGGRKLENVPGSLPFFSIVPARCKIHPDIGTQSQQDIPIKAIMFSEICLNWNRVGTWETNRHSLVVLHLLTFEAKMVNIVKFGRPSKPSKIWLQSA